MAFGRLFLSVVGVGFDLVICTPEPPSTWYIQISLEPIPNCAFETKMYFPSGAQFGDVNSLLGSLETCFTPVPSVFFFQAEDGIRDLTVTGVQTCALPI